MKKPNRHPFGPMLLTIAIGLSSQPAMSQECNVESFSELKTANSRYGIAAGNIPIGTTTDPTAFSPSNSGIPSIANLAVSVIGSIDGDPRLSGTQPIIIDRLIRGPYPSDRQTSCEDTAIYRITDDDLERWRQGNILSRAIAEWPWHLGAPVVDGDGNPDNYNLDGGDVPGLIGNQMVWWVMHDTERDDLPSMNLEYRAAAYVHAGAGALENTLFLSYEVENKGQTVIDSAHVAFSFSTALMEDVLAGTDTSRAALFTYPANATAHDGGPDRQPAFAVSLLEDFAISNHGVLFGSNFALTTNTLARNQEDLRHLLLGRDRKGELRQEGGTGTSGFPPPDSAAVTPYMFPGDPLKKEFWSMENVFGEPTGWPVQSAGRTSTQLLYQYFSGQPVTMSPGETRTGTIAIPSAKAGERIQSLERVFEYVDLLRANTGSLLKSSVSPKPGLTDPDLALSLVVTPNPAGSSATVRYSTPEPAYIAIELFDALGRRVRQVVDSTHKAGVFEERLDVADLTPGVYYMRFRILGKVFSRSLVVM